MKAVLYKRSDGQVLDVVEKVSSVADGNVIGTDHQIRGIDLAAAGVIVVDDTVKVKAGDKNFDPTKFVDLSGSLPQSDEQQLRQRIADLEITLADLYAKGGV